ncbi:MAG: cysteine desulfurase family protein [Deferrisomatales bacterium]
MAPEPWHGADAASTPQALGPLYGYFDYAASEPPFPEALRVQSEVGARLFGNPSSSHRRGLEARTRFEADKERLARLLGADLDARVVVVSGGTEANNLVIDSVMESRPRARLLLARDVHASAWYATKRWPDRVDVVDVGEDGVLDPGAVDAALTGAHALVSVLHGNNETGVVHDVRALAALCRRRGVALHVDGVQAVGRLPLELGALEGVFYTFSSHKFGAPRGSGGVLTGSPETLEARIRGGGQEQGLRGGTENPAAFAGAVAALERSLELRPKREGPLRAWAARIVERVTGRFPQTAVNSPPDGLPGFVSLSVPGLNGSMAVTEMAMRGFDLSAGSACHAGSSEPSRIIRAMGRDRITALGTLRITMGYGTADEEVEEMIAALLTVIDRGLEVR